jgi:hypothetical protein
MFSGDTSRRTSTGLGRNMQSCFRCYTAPNFGGNIYPPCMDPKLDTESFPATPCPGGIRSSVIFPLLVVSIPVGLRLYTDCASSCWDGKNLDSPNHKDHVSHPEGGPTPFAAVNGSCPASHPVKIPQVHYEVCGPCAPQKLPC